MLCENKTYATSTYTCSGQFDPKSKTFCGKCHIICSNADEYKGFLVNNKKHGKGTLKTKKYIYEGYWQNDKKHGEGKMCIRYPDTIAIYHGTFDNDIFVYTNCNIL